MADDTTAAPIAEVISTQPASLVAQLETVVKAIIADLEKLGVAEAEAKAAELKPVLGAAARAYVAAHAHSGVVGKLEAEAANVAINAIFGPAV